MNKEVVGFIDVKIYGKDAKIMGITVDDSYMEMGIGSALLESALELARKRGKSKVLLKVEQCNENAVNFYKRHGFNVKREVFDELVGNIYIMQKEFEN
jgi:ribosomal-protein-alanine N-acetyltransferase